jgi:hypothetical protein
MLFLAVLRIRIPDHTFHSDADPDPTFQLDTDPDPYPTAHFFPNLDHPLLQNDPLRLISCPFDADPDPASQNDSDPDPPHCFFVNKKIFLRAAGIRQFRD